MTRIFDHGVVIMEQLVMVLLIWAEGRGGDTVGSVWCVKVQKEMVWDVTVGCMEIYL